MKLYINHISSGFSDIFHQKFLYSNSSILFILLSTSSSLNFNFNHAFSNSKGNHIKAISKVFLAYFNDHSNRSLLITSSSDKLLNSDNDNIASSILLILLFNFNKAFSNIDFKFSLFFLYIFSSYFSFNSLLNKVVFQFVQSLRSLYA